MGEGLGDWDVKASDWIWLALVILALLGIIELSMLVGAVCPTCPLWFLG